MVLPDKFQDQMRVLRVLYPELPALPQVSGEFEGWFEEVGKRFATRQIRRTRDEQLKLVRQVNELHAEYVRYAKMASELQQTKVEIDRTDELKALRTEAERAELEFKVAEARDKRRKLEEEAARRNAAATQAQARPPHVPKEMRIAQMRKKMARAIEEHAADPEMQADLRRIWEDRIMKEMEGPE